MLQQTISDVSGVAAGGTMALVIPNNLNIDRLCLNFAGADATLARVKNPRLEVNGKGIINLAGLDLAELDKENQFHGRDAAIAGPPVQALIHFRRPEITAGGGLGLIDAERIMMLRTQNAGPVVFKAEIDAAYTAASAANFRATVVLKPGAAEPMGLFRFVRVYTKNLGAGFNALNELLPRKGKIISIHALANDVTELSLKRNGLPLIDRVQKADLQLVQDDDCRKADRTADANRTAIDFCSTGNLDEAVDVSQEGGCESLELDVTKTGGAQTNIVVEHLGTWNDF